MTIIFFWKTLFQNIAFVNFVQFDPVKKKKKIPTKYIFASNEERMHLFLDILSSIVTYKVNEQIAD